MSNPHNVPKTVYPQKVMHVSELQVCDVVHLPYVGEDPRISNPWSIMIVKDIQGNVVTFWRCYGSMSDFSYSGGVICYTGVETYQAYRDHKDLYYYVHERREYIRGEWTEVKEAK